jgi:hypothetical protein
MRTGCLDHQLYCPTEQVTMWEIWTTKHWILKRQTPLLLLQNLFIISKHPHSSRSFCFCVMLLRISSPQTPEYHLSWSKPLTKLSNHHRPLLILKFSRSSITSRAICSEFQQNSRVWILDHVSRAAQICLPHHVNEGACLSYRYIAGRWWWGLLCLNTRNVAEMYQNSG